MTLFAIFGWFGRVLEHGRLYDYETAKSRDDRQFNACSTVVFYAYLTVLGARSSAALGPTAEYTRCPTPSSGTMM